MYKLTIKKDLQSLRINRYDENGIVLTEISEPFGEIMSKAVTGSCDVVGDITDLLPINNNAKQAEPTTIIITLGENDSKPYIFEPEHNEDEQYVLHGCSFIVAL